MQEKVYITGHKNPDSDSICAAIAYANYKNIVGDYQAIPIRLGRVSRETQFILDYFGLEKPELKETIKLSVEDLDFDRVSPLSPDLSLKMALAIMEKNGLKSMPVADDDGSLIGMVTSSDIIRKYIDIWDNAILGRSGTTLDHIVETLSAKLIHSRDDRENGFAKTVVVAMDTKHAKDYVEKDDIAICGSREDAQLLCIDREVGVVVITGGVEPSKKVVERAKEKNINVIVSPQDTYTASKLISQAMPVRYAMTSENLQSFSIDDLVDEVRVEMTKTRFGAYPVVDQAKKVVGTLSRYHLISSKKKNIILVDHNERSQSIDGLEDAEILEIIDHHRVANVYTGKPIFFRNEPIGSTSSIIASIFFENGIRPSREIAGILAGALISDTLLLKSPTATKRDARILERLATIAEIDPEKFANEMFKAGTSLEGKEPNEIITQDFKEFKIAENIVAISQVFTMDMEAMEKMRADLLAEMESIRSQKGYSSLVLLLTDIFNESSEVVVVGDNKEKIAGAFGTTVRENVFKAPGVVSRKKQVVPPITAALQVEE